MFKQIPFMERLFDLTMDFFGASIKSVGTRQLTHEVVPIDIFKFRGFKNRIAMGDGGNIELEAKLKQEGAISDERRTFSIISLRFITRVLSGTKAAWFSAALASTGASCTAPHPERTAQFRTASGSQPRF